MCGAEDSGDTGHRVSFCIHTCVSTKGSNCLEGLNREGTSSSSAEASTVSLDVRACVRVLGMYMCARVCLYVLARACVYVQTRLCLLIHCIYVPVLVWVCVRTPGCFLRAWGPE